MPQPNRTNTRPPVGIGHVKSKKMYEYTIKHSGGTFTALGTPLELAHGFVLSLDPDRNITVPLRDFAPSTLTVFGMNNENYILDYNTQEQEPLKGFKMIGTWVVGDNVEIDVVTILSTKDVERVIELARQHGQRAVWDFSTRQAIDVDQWTS